MKISKSITLYVSMATMLIGQVNSLNLRQVRNREPRVRDLKSSKAPKAPKSSKVPKAPKSSKVPKAPKSSK
eukprot:scaffold6579_cov271-Chaetoceros_neogracile.AAC.4